MIASYSYAGPYRVTQRAYANGWTKTNSYDGARRNTEVEHTNNNGSSAKFNYTWDNEFNRTSEASVGTFRPRKLVLTNDYPPPVAPYFGELAIGIDQKESYSYDSAYRLTSAKLTNNLNNEVLRDNVMN